MRRFRGSVVAVVILAVVLGLSRLSSRDEAPEGFDPELLFRFDKDAMVGFAIERPDTTLEIRLVDGVWTTIGETWRPNRAMIRRVAHQLHDLDARANVVSDPDDPAVYGLGPGAIEVRVDLDDGETIALRVGDPNPTSVSYYMQRSPDPAVYVVKKAAMDFFRLDRAAFREDRIAQFDAADVVALTATVDGRRIAVERTGKLTWRMLEPVAQEASRDKVRTMLGRISAMRAIQFIADDPSDLSRWDLGEDADRIEVDLGAGSVVGIRVGDVAIDSGHRFVFHEPDRSVYLVKDGLLEPFGESADAMRNRVMIGKHEWDVVAMVVTGPDQPPLALNRSADDDWRWPDGSVIPGSTPDRVAGRAADLRAITFHDVPPADPGFDPPAATIALTFDDGTSATVELGRSWTVAADPGPSSDVPRSEQHQFARVGAEATVVEIDGGLIDVVEDLWREHAPQASPRCGQAPRRDGPRKLATLRRQYEGNEGRSGPAARARQGRPRRSHPEGARRADGHVRGDHDPDLRGAAQRRRRPAAVVGHGPGPRCGRAGAGHRIRRAAGHR